jgi:CRISPR/Cas system-associated exonuclease Cas4 (RecB family)
MSLIKIFDKAIKREPSTSTGRSMRPSSLGGKCLRKIYYAVNRVEKDYEDSDDLSRICKLGDAIHDMLKDAYRKAGILIDYYSSSLGPSGHMTNDEREFVISDADLEINKGKIDAIFNLDGVIWIGEFKSINAKGFDYLKHPKPEHIVQATIYYYVFNRMLAEGKYSQIGALAGFKKAAGIKFVYVCKDNAKMKEFTVNPSDTLFQEIVERIEYLKAIGPNDPLPPKTEDFCGNCSYREKCKANRNS